MISMRGTQFSSPSDALDFITDLGLGIGVPSEQFLQAYYFVEAVKAFAASTGKTISFAGHSLGGALATVFAARENAEAVVFNTALSEGIVNAMVDGARFGPEAAQQVIDAFGLTDPVGPFLVDSRPFSDQGHPEIIVAEETVLGDTFQFFQVEIPVIESFDPAVAANGIRSIRTRGEILSSFGFGFDFGANETILDIGEISNLPGLDTIQLHSIEFLTLLLAVEDNGVFPLVDVIGDFPLLAPLLFGDSAFDDSEFLGKTGGDEFAGITLQRELTRQHLETMQNGGSSLLLQLIDDIDSIKNAGGVIPQDDLLQQIFLEFAFQDAWRQMGFTDAEITGLPNVEGESFFGTGADGSQLTFDIKPLLDQGNVPAMLAIEELLKDALNNPFTGVEAPLGDLPEFIAVASNRQ